MNEKNNRIRFSDTQGIDYNTWTKILNRLNYLGYAIPDETSVKEYFDRHTWLNEDQSIEVLKIFNNEHTEETLYPKEQIKKHITQAIEMFGTTHDLSLAGYILPDGKLLKMSYSGHLRDIDHREINDVLQLDTDSPTKAMMQFINYGNIRITSGSLMFSRFPTDAQWAAISAYMRKAFNNNSCVSVDIINHTGTTVKAFIYEIPRTSTVMENVKNYFDSIKI